MKKFIYIAALALIAGAACTKVETETQQVKVTFQAANYVPQTKAGEVSFLDEFADPANAHFFSRAFLHAEGVDLDASGNVTSSFQQFFPTTGEQINWDAAHTIWAPASHDYYWPKGEKSFVNFISWYGTVNGTESNPTITYAYTADKWTAKLEWEYTATLGQATSNLLYADMAWRYKNNDGAIYKKDGVTEGVPTLFHHALSQINIKVYADDEAANENLTLSGDKPSDGTATWTIVLKNAKITPINSTGKLSLTNVDPGTNKTQEWTGSWAGTGAAAAVDITGTKTVDAVKKANATDFVAPSCVLPQTLSSSVVLSFDLDLTTTYSNASHQEIIPVSIKLNDMGTSEWAQNTKYTYYLRVVPSQKKVLFDPAVESAWITGTTTEKTI